MGTSTAPADGDLFSITDPAFQQCPFPHYARMLADKPVWRDPVTGFWVVTRYDDVRAVLGNPQVWSSRADQIFNRTSTVAQEVKAIYEAEGWLPLDTLVSNDPPEHKRYRALVDKALSPAKVSGIQGIIDATVEDLTTRMLEAGRLDFMRGFAIPLTMTMLGNQIGGAKPEDIDQLRYWTELQLEQINPVLAPERELEITREVVQFQQWLARAIERVRAEPDGTILSNLAAAEIDGERLDTREVIAIATLFFGAGHDTTTSALGSCVLYLARRPDVLARLREDPALVPNFVEEILRLEAPVQRLFRRALSDTSIEGVEIAAGEVVLIQYGGANRDARKFECPDELRPDRSDAARHLTFGAGIHFCVGNQLARAELRTALAAIVRRCAAIELADGDSSYAYHEQFISRALSRLEIVVTAG